MRLLDSSEPGIFDRNTRRTFVQQGETSCKRGPSRSRDCRQSALYVLFLLSITSFVPIVYHSGSRLSVNSEKYELCEEGRLQGLVV